jgi:lysophospholipase L1-like esterase
VRRLRLTGLVILTGIAASGIGLTAIPVSAQATVMRTAPRELAIAAPRTLYLSAPPYVYSAGIITYGAQAALEQVRDGATAVNPEISKKPIKPDRGFRWIGVRMWLQDTGSQDLTYLVPVLTGSDDQVYYGSDATMPGCAQLATFPPRSLKPGQSLAACDTYELPDKVSPRLLRINIGFSNPSASGFWQVSARPLAAPKFPASYVALGDSYSSGEGAGDYEAKLETCHRSASAWPRLLARDLPRLLRMRYGALLACSGATSQALTGHREGQPDQLADLHDLVPRPTLVTITMGGNDIGFPAILTNCVLTLGSCIADGRLAKAETAIEHEQHTLVTDYRKLQAADPKATILVVGYPRLFPVSEDDVLLRCQGWLTDAVRASLNQLDADLNAVIHAAAAEAGLRYLDVTEALNNHEGCTAHSWLYPIVRPLQQQSGHPIRPGQEALAAIIRSYLHSM